MVLDELSADELSADELSAGELPLYHLHYIYRRSMWEEGIFFQLMPSLFSVEKGGVIDPCTNVPMK
jgi:hypothetical protein